ncbi:GSCFA domain-containing protein [Oceanibium sediminis]|uniref:GSCFA domain-containing protein n=1 Tax=Oceanibium sediminis TaxID=2026339 RepID=UPI000DD46D9F|nr:GSCFA domain-containing protein [Oceanibium sediminis]
MNTSSPYKDLPERAYWKTAVAERSPLDPGDLYDPKFGLDKNARITTAGSCFAQHVGRALRNARFRVMDTEPAPKGVSDTVAQKFGYGMYSARYGNIYTVRQLNQLLGECLGNVTPAEPVWEHNGRYFDAQRPSVEPTGFETREDVIRHRSSHLTHALRAFQGCDVFVFTFGLTEAWVHEETGTVYPTAPGTMAGRYDPARFSFRNYKHSEILDDFVSFRETLKKISDKNPKFIITTSPVPLTATASGAHVEVANSHSKAVLRAVCGELYHEFDDVDYFPSYEIITSLNSRGAYFESNKRSVSQEGVEKAMSLFLKAHGATRNMSELKTRPVDLRKRRRARSNREDDIVCEEVLLESFAK